MNRLVIGLLLMGIAAAMASCAGRSQHQHHPEFADVTGDVVFALNGCPTGVVPRQACTLAAAADGTICVANGGTVNWAGAGNFKVKFEDGTPCKSGGDQKCNVKTMKMSSYVKGFIVKYDLRGSGANEACPTIDPYIIVMN